MPDTDLSWSVPVMRAGYAGRGLTYLVIAGASLFAILQGGQAKGTGEAMQAVGSTPGGIVVLILVALGLFAYTIWRLVDAFWDLEAYGSDAKALIGRAGMVVTGLIHAALGVAAVSLIFGSGGGGNSKIAHYVGEILALPYGRWLIGAAAICTIGAGIYYVHKGLTESYRENLTGNRFTMRFNWALKAGLVAQGLIVGLIGAFLGLAALHGDPESAGGLQQVFDFLRAQPFGNVIVAVICVGLLGFSLFCFVNARYRIVPRVAGDDTETLAARLRSAKRQAVRQATG